MKILTVCLGFCIHAVCIAQNRNIALAGENYLILNGGKFRNARIVFAKADGDWFVTGNDAHSTLTLYSTYDNRQMRFDLEWDGKNETAIITNEKRHASPQAYEFLVTLPDKEVYGDGLIAYPDGDEKMILSAIKMDDMAVVATISGNISNRRDHIKVNGIISLKKTITGKTATTSSYKDCDNVIHDKLIGAENRSPTDCEVKFDLDVRRAVHDAFEPLINHFTKETWRLENETPVKPITGVGRGTEKNFFNPGFSDGGNYAIHLVMDEASSSYRKWYDQYNAIMEDLKRDPTKAGNVDKLTSFGVEEKGATQINIHVFVNQFSTAATNFSSMHMIERPEGASRFIYLKNEQAATGGGKENSGNAAWLYIGKWGEPKFEKFDDGSEQVSMTAIINKTAPHLSVQAIAIKIEANDELANRVLTLVDIHKLDSLIAH